jgi:hypothetical protein
VARHQCFSLVQRAVRPHHCGAVRPAGPARRLRAPRPRAVSQPARLAPAVAWMSLTRQAVGVVGVHAWVSNHAGVLAACASWALALCCAWGAASRLQRKGHRIDAVRHLLSPAWPQSRPAGASESLDMRVCVVQNAWICGDFAVDDRVADDEIMVHQGLVAGFQRSVRRVSSASSRVNLKRDDHDLVGLRRMASLNMPTALCARWSGPLVQCQVADGHTSVASTGRQS